MIRYLKIFWKLSFYSIKITLQHQIGVIAFLSGKILRFIIYFLFLYYLVSRTKLLAGYTVQQTIIFFLTFNFIDNLTQLLFREVYRFRPLIVSGEFNGILLKPHHPFLRILIGGIDILDFVLIFPYLFLLVFFIKQTSFFSLFNVLLYLGLIINALVIATAFHIIVLAMAIFTTEIDHTVMIYRDLTKMVSLPVDIYKEPIRSFLTFIIPIGVMMSVPVKALFGLLSTKVFVLSILIAFTFIMFALLLWNNALKKYQSWGG